MSTLDNHPHGKDFVRLRKLATRMDGAVRLPIIGVKVGWDAVLGLIPGIGDALAFAPSAFIINEARKMGAPKTLLARMGVNAGIDVFIGSIPLVGDIFDVGWRSKTKNVDLLEAHLDRVGQKARIVSSD